MRITKKTFLHPLFIYAIIFVLECIPTDNQDVFYEMPKEGDNFKSTTSDNVYYFSNNSRYQYTSEECYFRLGNPPFSNSYKDGGIKTISYKIVDAIPLKGSMCEDQKSIEIKPKQISFTQKYLTLNYFLGNFSSFSHVFFYLLLCLSILYYFRKNKNNYWIAFTACFIGGGLLELIQHYFIRGRNATIDDLILNAIGALLGLLIYWWLSKKYTQLH